MVSGMRTATPALPSLAVTDVFLKDPEAPAESTQSGLEAGLIVAYRGSVDAMVDSYAEAIEMGARLVLTGGGAAFVSSGLLRSHVMARDLKHMAMAMVLGNDRTAYT
jgi:pantothenate kinase type III